MTTTATTTDKQVDREAPVVGKLNPVKHRVRIVVLPTPRGASGAHEGNGSDHSHSLTDDQLSAAERALKTMAPPPITSPAGVAPGSPKPNSMFEALNPTDIVVVGRETASVRTVDSSGKPVSADATTQAHQTAPEPTRRLFAHDDRHRDTVLRVWTESDTIEYECDEEFEIVKVERAGWKIHGAPQDPFANARPYRAERRQHATGGEPLWAWTSSVLPATANNQQYKMTFKINGELIDPDVICGFPPPTP